MEKYKLIIGKQRFEDLRGFFYESYSKEKMLTEQDLDLLFVQDNHSISKKDVIRGMHYQWDGPMGKLVRVSKGSIIDVIVDIRKSSDDYGKAFYFELSDKNSNQLWIPAGYAHGFVSLEDDTHVQYKCTELYNKNGESGINPLDTSLRIQWNVKNPIMSEKDLNSKSFIEYNTDPKF